MSFSNVVHDLIFDAFVFWCVFDSVRHHGVPVCMRTPFDTVYDCAFDIGRYASMYVRVLRYTVCNDWNIWLFLLYEIFWQPYEFTEESHSEVAENPVLFFSEDVHEDSGVFDVAFVEPVVSINGVTFHAHVQPIV